VTDSITIGVSLWFSENGNGTSRMRQAFHLNLLFVNGDFPQHLNDEIGGFKTSRFQPLKMQKSTSHFA